MNDLQDSPTRRVVAGGRVSGRWTAEEDDLLIKLVNLHGAGNWAEIGRGLPGRAGKACRERFVNHLDPHLVKAEWTTDEDAHLIRLVAELGEAWADIARRLPGRAEGSIKNRFNRLTGRRKKSFHPKALDLKAAVTAITKQDIHVAVPPRGAPSVLWSVHDRQGKPSDERGAVGRGGPGLHTEYSSRPHGPHSVLSSSDMAGEDRAVAAAALTHMGTVPMPVPTHTTAALPSHAAPGIQVAGVKRRRAEDEPQRLHDKLFAPPSHEPHFASPLPYPTQHMYAGYPPGQWVYAVPPAHAMTYHAPDAHMHTPSQWPTYNDWGDPTTQYAMDMRQAVTQRLPSPLVYRSASTGRHIEPSPASMYAADASHLLFQLPPPHMPHIRGHYTHGAVGHPQSYEAVAYPKYAAVHGDERRGSVEGYS